MSTSTAYHHGDLRAALLRAAGELLEQQGIAALSLREAARRAGVSHNAPYRHFPQREALLAALAAEGFRMLADGQAAAARERGLAYVRFALEHPQRFRLMFGGVVPIGSHPELREQGRRAYQKLEDAFRELGDDARLAAAAAWSLVHGLANLILDGHFAQAQRDSGGAEAFAAKVLGMTRFARAPQRSA
jgi:AcrR family transcriptional regulator